jgi:hypothetical protein
MIWAFLQFIWPYGVIGGIIGLIGYFIVGNEENDGLWVWGGGILGIIIGLFVFFNDTSVTKTDNEVKYQDNIYAKDDVIETETPETPSYSENKTEEHDFS